MKHKKIYMHEFSSRDLWFIETSWQKVVISVFVLSLIISSSFAQQKNFNESMKQIHQPLAKILNADGSINGSITRGSYNAKGYKMTVGKNGAPRFTASDPNNKNWDPSFTVAGVGGNVSAVASDGDSLLYVGGLFGTVPGNIIANNIAVYNLNTGKWSALDTISSERGVNGEVDAIAVNGNDVFIGGVYISSAGGVPVNNIVDYNNSTKTWTPLGSGITNGIDIYGSVDALTYYSGNLYVGGIFTTAGGDTVNNIARWDGSSWHALGSGIGDGVFALAVSGGYLYVGGRFRTAGSDTANYIAKWNGTEWSHVGTSGTDIAYGVVNAILPAGKSLYIGGSFVTVAGKTVNSIAKWNGNSWSAVGSGISQDQYDEVNSLIFFSGKLYVAGHFTLAGLITVNNIAEVDTSTNTWSAMGTGSNVGLNNPSLYNNLVSSKGKLFVPGSFSTAGGIEAFGIAAWDGNSWSSLSTDRNNSPGGKTWTLALSGSKIYIGGKFSTAGPVIANNVAVYNTETRIWSSLGTGFANGVNGIVYAIDVSGNNVYVGGEFDHAGGVPANNIAMWNGTKWNTLGTSPNDGVDNYGVDAIATDGKDSILYVGGTFAHAGGKPANNIAIWDGTSWQTLGQGTNNSVYAIAVGTNNIYAGGYFSDAGGSPASNIAQWNGTAWSAIGSPTDGVDGYVYALAAYGDTVYVGGNFTHAGGISAYNIAKWNTKAWVSLNARAGNYTIDALDINDTSLFVGGNFTTKGAIKTNYIVEWNIEKGGFSGLGDGLNGEPGAIVSKGNDIYVCGFFSIAGGKPSYSFAHYNPGGITAIKVKPSVVNAFKLWQNYPNPFNPSTTINYQLALSSHVTLKVYDILGREVTTLVNEYEKAGSHQAIFNASRLASGVYFYRLTAEKFSEVKKLMVLK